MKMSNIRLRSLGQTVAFLKSAEKKHNYIHDYPIIFVIRA